MYKIAVLHRYPIAQVLGTNASFLEFIKQLTSKGNKVYYITYKDSADSPNIENLEYIRLPFFFNRGNNFDKVLKTYIWILIVPVYVFYVQLKYKIDLVYCDDSVPYFGFFSKILSPWSKVVIRLGDLQSGYAFADTNPSIFKLAIFFEKKMWEMLDGLVAISEPFKNYLVNLGIDSKKISVVEESIDLSSLKNAERGNLSDVTTILFHGALLKCKGVSTLLEALSILNSKYPNKFRLIIAGGGEEEASLKNLTSSLNLKNVEFTGWYDHKKLEEIMKIADLSVVMRSPNMANNFVVTTCLLENWAFRKPVVAPNLESFKKVIDGTNGILFNVGDPADLADKIYALSQSQSKINQLKKNGYETAQKLFDHRYIAKKMANTLLKYI